MSFITKKRNRSERDFEKKTVRNRLRLEFIKKHEYEKIIKQQSKLTFNGIQKSYENFHCYILKNHEVFMDKPIYIGFSVLELSKLLINET